MDPYKKHLDHTCAISLQINLALFMQILDHLLQPKNRTENFKLNKLGLNVNDNKEVNVWDTSSHKTAPDYSESRRTSRACAEPGSSPTR